MSFAFNGAPATLHGFFVSSDYGIDDKVQSLQFLFDIEWPGQDDGYLLPIVLPMTLGAGVSATISEMIAIYLQEENNRFFDDDPEVWVSPEYKAVLKEVFNNLGPGAISLFLYICSVNAEFRDNGDTNRSPGKPVAKKTRDGIRLFPPEQPIVWDTAWRIGAALRSYGNTSSHENKGERERMRPHVRRAHWHTFLTGPLNGPRDVRVKWLPPIAVNVAAAGGPESLVPVVRDASISQTRSD